MYLADYCFWTLAFVCRISELRFSRVAADEMALLLTADAEPHEIARAFNCHYTTVYYI
jgi:hypothetical protein